MGGGIDALDGKPRTPAVVLDRIADVLSRDVHPRRSELSFIVQDQYGLVSVPCI
jgi:hypothetical protein